MTEHLRWMNYNHPSMHPSVGGKRQKNKIFNFETHVSLRLLTKTWMQMLNINENANPISTCETVSHDKIIFISMLCRLGILIHNMWTFSQNPVIPKPIFWLEQNLIWNPNSNQDVNIFTFCRLPSENICESLSLSNA